MKVGRISARQNFQNRVKYVDLYRGIGIILMIMAHIGFGGVFDHYIHAFHMPMFFFVSGYFFKLNSPKRFFWQKAKTLLIPYVFYTVIIYFGWKMVCGEPANSLVETLINMKPSEFVAAQWFLTALFIANMTYWLIHILFRNDIYVSIVAFMLALCGNLIQLFYKKPCIFSFDAGLVGVGIMHFGYLCRHCRIRIIEKIMKLTWTETILTFSLLSALIAANEKVNMREGKYGLLPLFWINAIGMCIVLWNVARKLMDLQNEKCFKSWIVNIYSIIENIGRRSLVFLCLNQTITVIIFGLFPIRTGAHSFIVVIHNTIVLFAALTLLYLLAIIRETAMESIRFKIFKYK